MSLVLLVDDHPALRAWVGHAITRQGHLLLAVASADGVGGEVLQQWVESPPFAIVTRAAGHDQAARVRERLQLAGGPLVPLLVMGQPPSRDGVDVHSVAEDAPRDLLLLLGVFAARQANPPRAAPRVLAVGGLKADVENGMVWAGRERLNLSPTHLRLLCFLMSHPDRTFSRARLLEYVCSGAGDNERVVDVHVYRLRAQLARHGLADVIESVRGSGYRLLSGRLPEAAPLADTAYSAFR